MTGPTLQSIAVKADTCDDRLWESVCLAEYKNAALCDGKLERTIRKALRREAGHTLYTTKAVPITTSGDTVLVLGALLFVAALIVINTYLIV